MPRWLCREGRAGKEEKALPSFPSAKLFCAHMSLTGTSLLFSWQSNAVVRDVFTFAPATLAEINTPMSPPAKRFPQRCNVPGSPSLHGEFAEQKKSWARGNEAEKKSLSSLWQQQPRGGCEEQKVTVTMVLYRGASGWLSITQSSLCLGLSQLLGLKR